VKNRRLYAILLLAALALLQIRVAVAACAMTAQTEAGSLSACCDGHESTANAAQPVGDARSGCAMQNCAQPNNATKADERALLGPHLPEFAHAPGLAAFSALPSDGRLHLSVAPAHTAHTALIYVLQRLLI
jgi:hypothetical protein